MKPGVIYNQDCTEFFVVHPASAMCGELVDTFVDNLAEAGVAALFTNPAAQRVNYASSAREPIWHGYDPAGPDDQPYFTGYPTERLRNVRPMLDAMVELDRRGIDFHARALARCRHHGIEGWISLRMNDVHDVELANSPLLETYWKEHPEYRRVPYRFTQSFDRELDYARPEVRQYNLALVLELLARYDLDGLELDFMRFPYHFRIGQELAGGALLTAWLGEIRAAANARGRELGHPVRLAVRVPADPESARQMGLDAVQWADDGLIDLVVITPFWETCDFNMPVCLWRRLLARSGVRLAAGLEILARGYRQGVFAYQTPDSAAGAAMAALHGGADHVYLFNFFYDMPGQPTGLWTQAEGNQLLSAMASPEALAQLPRRHLLTYRDTRAPGEACNETLPQTGTLAIFRLATGPRPVGRRVTVTLGFRLPSEQATFLACPRVRVNSVLCTGAVEVQGANATYVAPTEALADEVTTVEVESVNDKPFTIIWVEVRVEAHDR